MAYEYTREVNLRDSVCTLIKKNTYLDEDGVPQEGEPTKKEVFCRVGSIYEKEFYDAYQAGIKSQFKVVIFAYDYDNEKIVELEGNVYSIYRRYYTGDNIELYLRSDVEEWD